MKYLHSVITQKPLIFYSLLLLGIYMIAIAAKVDGPVWTDPHKASDENPDFLLQGEYVGNLNEAPVGLQVVALGDDRFLVSRYAGGLPGALFEDGKLVWDKENRAAEKWKTPSRSELEGSEAKALVESLERVERKSPTVGQEPPPGAVVLFDGETLRFKDATLTDDGHLLSGTESKGDFGDFHLHVEFRLPFKPETPVSSQDRGNSGVYLFGRYEVQVLDSFGLDLDEDRWPEKPKSHPSQWCGSFYKSKVPDANLCLPPLTWQTYDIDFTAPRFNASGEKTANARATVYHNGVKIHADVELEGGTGAARFKREVPEGPIQLQGHGNPVVYRNVWLVEK